MKMRLILSIVTTKPSTACLWSCIILGLHNACVTARSWWEGVKTRTKLYNNWQAALKILTKTESAFKQKGGWTKMSLSIFRLPSLWSRHSLRRTVCHRSTSQRAADVRAPMDRRLATAQNQIASQSSRHKTPMNKQQLSASPNHCLSPILPCLTSNHNPGGIRSP